MTQVLFGERLSKQAELRLGCSAVLFDENHEKVLLTRRKDNGSWCLPGGMVEPGESVAECCRREVWEETALKVHVLRLAGIYSDPNHVIVYPDGVRAFVVVLNFEVKYISGTPQLSNETTAIEWFPIHKATGMDLFHGHAQHIRDAVAGQEAAFIR